MVLIGAATAPLQKHCRSAWSWSLAVWLDTLLPGEPQQELKGSRMLDKNAPLVELNDISIAFGGVHADGGRRCRPLSRRGGRRSSATMAPASRR
jgi:hypothetical protein